MGVAEFAVNVSSGSQHVLRNLLIKYYILCRSKWEQLLQIVCWMELNRIGNNHKQGSITMKFVKTIFVICLIVIAAMPISAQNGQRMRNGGRNGCANCPLAQTTFAAQPLSAEEVVHLLYMREEEKLALDIYQALYSKWNMRIFSNIASSEQRHFDAVGTLISRYKLSDPAQATAGVFTNPDLQKLYNDLLAKGNLTLLDALEVGVTIEETDIADLKAAIAVTDNKDVLTVYGNLLNGSLNHLSAFNSHIETASSN
jgi:hypothetical protein